ncbi:MAG: hypothetical protein GYA24_11180 [Candidatus Lokiarchaeota archaeon]|nr:hypothetical protein [Candidatus Lokiarchaeota archaeon]
MLARRANRWFDNEKLLMYNYLQNVLKMDIDDLVILARTIFVLLTSQDYDRLPHKPELKTVLDLILEKCTFLLPANDELDEMLRAIFDPGMIEQIQTRLDAGCVRVRIWINPQRKPEFFQKFKRFFDDITFFFKHVYGPDFKFQFS